MHRWAIKPRAHKRPSRSPNSVAVTRTRDSFDAGACELKSFKHTSLLAAEMCRQEECYVGLHLVGAATLRQKVDKRSCAQGRVRPAPAARGNRMGGTPVMSARSPAGSRANASWSTAYTFAGLGAATFCTSSCTMSETRKPAQRRR